MLKCSIRSLAGPELPGHAGDQHAPLEEQPGLEPKGALVVEQLLPGAANHVLGNVDDDQSARVGGTQLDNVAKDRPVISRYGASTTVSGIRMSRSALPFQLLNLSLPSRDCERRQRIRPGGLGVRECLKRRQVRRETRTTASIRDGIVMPPGPGADSSPTWR